MNSIRASIEIKLLNNEIVRYVNPVTQDSQGKNGEYYSYTNEVGVDDFALQAGPGKVKGDYDTLVAQIGGTGVVTWPEGGTEIIRKNTDNNMASLSMIRKTIPKSAIVSISVIEQEVNEWVQLELDRNVV